MIYITVGTYPFGFDRLIKVMDDLSNEIKIPIVAQISGGSYMPTNMKFMRYFSEDEHFDLINRSRLVIAHGGFGIIGDCLRMKKKLIVVPRALSEGPNDQRPVATRLAEKYGFKLCKGRPDIKATIFESLRTPEQEVDYNLECNVPTIINKYLQSL